jgi:hypothetical protein
MHYLELRKTLDYRDECKRKSVHFFKKNDSINHSYWKKLFQDWDLYANHVLNQFNKNLSQDWFGAETWDEKLEVLKNLDLVSLRQKDGLIRFENRNSYNAIWSQLKQVRWWVYFRDNSICQFCRTKLVKNDSHIDHVIPYSALPKEFLWLANHSTNLVASCQNCNLSKSNKLQFPVSNAAFISIDSCQPMMQSDLKDCLKNNELDADFCPGCGSKKVEILCAVHGFIYSFICQISIKSGCDSHGI